MIIRNTLTGDETEVDLYRPDITKQVIESYQEYTIIFASHEEEDLSTLVGSDDQDLLQNRWNLLVYLEFMSGKDIPEGDIIELYSLEEGEYDMYENSEPIVDLLEESKVFRLTPFELNMLKKSTFDFDNKYIDLLNHADPETREIIMSKSIPRSS